jgi:hypothetical protein
MAWVLPTWYGSCMPNGRNLVWLFWVSLQRNFLLQPLLGSDDISWE